MLEFVKQLWITQKDLLVSEAFKLIIELCLADPATCGVLLALVVLLLQSSSRFDRREAMLWSMTEVKVSSQCNVIHCVNVEWVNLAR